jgi:CRISPR-associated endonuclease/helicase Cas3
MGSDARWYPVSGPDHRPGQAAALLTATGWSCLPAAAAISTLAARILNNRAPNLLQHTVLHHPLDQLMIAEAPTGDGKTEAALLWCARLVEAGAVDGLYFAVPTRSAATELHDRVARSLSQAYPQLAGHTVRAVPGLLSTDPRDPTLPPTWALGSTRRVMGAPVAVGTIDQALLSVLRVRHSWLRSWCLSRHLLVIDEVHASDAYMSAIVSELVDAHRNAGGYVLLMSATLGETMAARLTRRPRLPVSTATCRKYPLVSSGTVSAMPVSTRSKTACVKTEPHVDCIQHAMQAVQSGKTVLWIRSTVTDALHDYRLFEAATIPAMLHHSRYADIDRQFLDGEVTDCTGIGGMRTPSVIVATQTCVQSLDIDADILLSRRQLRRQIG